MTPRQFLEVGLVVAAFLAVGSVLAGFAERSRIPTLAVPAVVISIAFVALMTHWLGGLAGTTALLFGALIASTDPVAVVETFRRVGVPERLATLVTGESLMNDGIAIVVFNIALAAAAGAQMSPLAVAGRFAEVFLGGAAVGAIVGTLAMMLLTRIHNVAATSLTVAVAYAGFAVADLIGWSGPIAALAAGFVAGAGQDVAMTAPVRRWLGGVWGSVDFSLNAVLFLLLGVEVNLRLLTGNAWAIVLGIAVVYVARPLGVATILPISTRLSRTPRVSAEETAVISWGGVRGAVSLALALSTSPSTDAGSPQCRRPGSSSRSPPCRACPPGS